MNIQKFMGHLKLLRRWLGLLCALLVPFSPAGSRAADFSGSFATSNLEISVYSPNALAPDAIWKINTVTPGHRRMGFFGVKLLPVMVVDGIQLEFTTASPQTNWLEGFRCEWAPAASRGIFEWQDFSIFFPQEKTPRLQARRVHPVANAGSLICRLEGITLQTGSRPIHLPRAEVRAEGPAGAIVWREAAATIQWDLFSGQFTTNTIVVHGTSNEKL
ncbi:MAG: hypothetical protein WAO02_14135 [Verrucomicrobiia bacterium]